MGRKDVALIQYSILARWINFHSFYFFGFTLNFIQLRSKEKRFDCDERATSGWINFWVKNLPSRIAMLALNRFGNRALFDNKTTSLCRNENQQSNFSCASILMKLNIVIIFKCSAKCTLSINLCCPTFDMRKLKKSRVLAINKLRLFQSEPRFLQWINCEF